MIIAAFRHLHFRFNCRTRMFYRFFVVLRLHLQMHGLCPTDGPSQFDAHFVSHLSPGFRAVPARLLSDEQKRMEQESMGMAGFNTDTTSLRLQDLLRCAFFSNFPSPEHLRLDDPIPVSSTAVQCVSAVVVYSTGQPCICKGLRTHRQSINHSCVLNQS